MHAFIAKLPGGVVLVHNGKWRESELVFPLQQGGVHRDIGIELDFTIVGLDVYFARVSPFQASDLIDQKTGKVKNRDGIEPINRRFVRGYGQKFLPRTVSDNDGQRMLLIFNPRDDWVVLGTVDGVAFHDQLYILIGVDLDARTLARKNAGTGRAEYDQDDKEKALFHKLYQVVIDYLYNPAGWQNRT